MSEEEPKKKKEEKLNPPTELFADMVCTGGGCVADCELCGRVHFDDCNSGYDWEDGELEGLRDKAEKDPAKYIRHTDTGVASGWIGGRQVVWGCQCNKLSQLIARDLTALAKMKVEQAERLVEETRYLGDPDLAERVKAAHDVLKRKTRIFDFE